MDEIEKLARSHGTGGWQTLEDMVKFGKAVQAAERAKCAALCRAAQPPGGRQWDEAQAACFTALEHVATVIERPN